MEDEDVSEPADEASPDADGAGASGALEPLDPLEDSVCWEPPAGDSGWGDAGDSGAPADAVSLPLLDGASSEAAADASVELASWALATPTGSSTSHTRAPRSHAQSHALERLFLEELAFILITTAST